MSRWNDLAARGAVIGSVPLAPFTTYKVGGPATWFAEPESSENLLTLAEALGDDPLPVAILGKGSNVLVSDTGFPGLVIRLGPAFAATTVTEAGIVEAGGAAALPLVARVATKSGRGGLEFLVGIPGTVGGAIRMNAGCHGSEISDRLVEVRIIDLCTAAEDVATSESLELGYRYSNLSDCQVVVWASFWTDEVDQESGEDLMRAISRWRKEKQPGGTLNAGSIFKNPPGDAAGRIIDEAGLKGLGFGSVSVSEKHANFFVSRGETLAQDVYSLIKDVQQKVLEKSGILLTPEIRFLGSFAEGGDVGSSTR